VGVSLVSEKSRYIDINNDPVRQHDDMSDFIKQLPLLGSDRLSLMLAVRSECDPILCKILSVSLAFQNPNADLENIMPILYYAIYIPDLVSDLEGHEQILDEILWQVNHLAENGNNELAKQIAKYSLARGHEMVENFEEGFSWNCSLGEIKKWLVSAEDKN